MGSSFVLNCGIAIIYLIVGPVSPVAWIQSPQCESIINVPPFKWNIRWQCRAVVENCHTCLLSPIVKYLAYLRKRTATNPRRGHWHHRSPARILFKTIRGMIPHKTERGQAALERLKVGVIWLFAITQYLNLNLNLSCWFHPYIWDWWWKVFIYVWTAEECPQTFDAVNKLYFTSDSIIQFNLFPIHHLWQLCDQCSFQFCLYLLLNLVRWWYFVPSEIN